MAYSKEIFKIQVLSNDPLHYVKPLGSGNENLKIRGGVEGGLEWRGVAWRGGGGGGSASREEHRKEKEAAILLFILFDFHGG
jgi:hypothetical protein